MARKEYMVEWRRIGKPPKRRTFGTRAGVNGFMRVLTTPSKQFRPLMGWSIYERPVGRWSLLHHGGVDDPPPEPVDNYASRWIDIVSLCHHLQRKPSQQEIASRLDVGQATVSRTLARYRNEWESLAFPSREDGRVFDLREFSA